MFRCKKTSPYILHEIAYWNLIHLCKRTFSNSAGLHRSFVWVCMQELSLLDLDLGDQWVNALLCTMYHAL